MATLTQVIATVADSSGQARAEIDVDDTTDPANFDLIAVRVVNGMDRSCFVDIRRGNGASWFTVEVAADSTRSQSSGGPVRKVNDIPGFMLRTV